MSVGNIAQGGGDPRMSISGQGAEEKFAGGDGITSYTRPQLLGIRDPKVKFEE